MKKLYFILFLVGCCQAVILGQQSNLDSLDKNKEIELSLRLYNTLLLNPGLKIQVQYPLKTTIKSKTVQRKKGDFVKTKTRQFLAEGSLTGYWEMPTHSAFILGTQIGFKKTNQKGFFTGVWLGPGFARTFTRNTYEVNDNHEVSKKALAGHNYFAPTLSFGLGKNSQKKPNRRWETRLNFTWLMPFNSKQILMPGIEIGF